MPRTVESIVDGYNAANERLKAGKPAWDHHLKIKHLLTDDVSDEACRRVGAEIATILRSSDWLRDDEKGTGPSEITVCAEEFEEVTDVDHLNEVLDRLYDLADADRVWIG